MVTEDDADNILEYLKKQGQANTYRLASELGIDRHRILNIVKKLEEKRAVEVKSGIVRFLKFPRKEKKVVKKLKVKKVPSKPKKDVKHKKTVLEIAQAENKRLKERISELETNIKRQLTIKNNKLREQAEQIENLEKKVKELKSLPPKIIRRTKVKKIPILKRVKPKKLKEQAEYIKELEEKIKELQEKKPKIIRRTIVKEVPKIIRKTIIKKVPIKVKEKQPKKEEEKPKKFRLPKIKLSGLKNIKKLHVPEILKK